MARTNGYRRSAVWRPCGVTLHAALQNKRVICSGSRVTNSTVMKLRGLITGAGLPLKRIQRALAHNGRKIPSCTADLNLCQCCTWLFSRMPNFYLFLNYYLHFCFVFCCCFGHFIPWRRPKRLGVRLAIRPAVTLARFRPAVMSASFRPAVMLASCDVGQLWCWPALGQLWYIYIYIW